MMIGLSWDTFRARKLNGAYHTSLDRNEKILKLPPQADIYLLNFVLILPLVLVFIMMIGLSWDTFGVRRLNGAYHTSLNHAEKILKLPPQSSLIET